MLVLAKLLGPSSNRHRGACLDNRALLQALSPSIYSTNLCLSWRGETESSTGMSIAMQPTKPNNATMQLQKASSALTWLMTQAAGHIDLSN